MFKVGDKVTLVGERSNRCGVIKIIVKESTFPYSVHFSESSYGYFKENELQPAAFKQRLLETLENTIRSYRNCIDLVVKENNFATVHELTIQKEEVQRVIELINHMDED